MILDHKSAYKTTTIDELLIVRLRSLESTFSKGTNSIRVYSVNKKSKFRCNKILAFNEWAQSINKDILLIDITGWKKVDKTIKGKRAEQLRDFCNQYKDVALAVIVYDDTNPAEQVIESVRDILPNLQMKHFSTCNNVAGKHRAAWFYAKNK